MNGCYTTVMVIMGRSEREERENFFSRKEKAGLLQRSSGHNGGTLSDLSAARVWGGGHKKHHLHTHNREKEGEKEGVSSLSISQSHPTSAFTTSPFLFLSHYCGPPPPPPHSKADIKGKSAAAAADRPLHLLGGIATGHAVFVEEERAKWG